MDVDQSDYEGYSSGEDYYSDMDVDTDDGEDRSQLSTNSNNDDNGEDDEDDDPETATTSKCREETYAILSEDDIRNRQEEAVTELTTILSISGVAASILLCYYNWNASNVHDAWFADEEQVRNKVGLLNEPVIHYANNKPTCVICSEDYPKREMYNATCGHLFCSSCWGGYITTSINDGPGCLTLRCPDPSCKAAVGQDMIEALVSEEDNKKYLRYLTRSYVEASKKIKWCPSPGCDNAVEFVLGSGSYYVSCNCKYSFCWNCAEDTHRPLDCSTVANWTLKNTAESENANWIVANSKPCPKCDRPIEKNNGCMHMVCSPPCNFHFCWLCLGPYSEHGEKTGGFYACNRYDAAKKEGLYDEIENRRKMSKHSLQRYVHYHERWTANHKSMLKAMTDLKEMEDGHIEKLIRVQSQPQSQLNFLIEAWVQIVECRRVLKWTYAYGYYLPEHEHVKRQLFEYLQGNAESGLECLHQCAEKDVQTYLNAKTPSESFSEFRQKLADLTRLTRNYFENLLSALENGLADVQSLSYPAAISKASSGAEIWSCKFCSYDNNESSGECRICERQVGSWDCDHCTSYNGRSATSCGTCNARRIST